ncbi:AMP-binding protein [Pseudomonas aeruginosa]|uniref:AMP-binding protein n=1 Tax=Pseudomonas aeruginosa TaxID=287 RepID=UPI000F53A280|nr:AMP-binding protein [Pseudomonas aeruginosa]ELK4837217.1 AMP-binding protein [Pseudomonas aeruginosa]MBX5595353.1 AMP-binding protein [Pseudomonas aeruginosa]MCK1851501.1 AMP-binding protein [Pseudomonas aeruginosa]MCK1864603.1 AMP-binding protein [Pseudomonas aeruginosa]MCK1872982.1 AMP-binding protein [Pseudomonas aeruginosa]
MPHEVNAFRERLRTYATERASQPAVRGMTGNVTYAQLMVEVERREAWLREQAKGPFALALENGPEALFWDLAALFAERPCVILPPFFSAAQRRHCLMQTQATIAVASDAYAEDLRAAGFAPGERFWERSAEIAAGIPPGTAKITYTSGSTGSPKGVCLSASSLLRVAQELEAASRPAEPTKYLAVLPLAVLLENLGLYAALLAGASVTLYPQAQMGIGGASQVDWQRFLGTLALSGAESLILVPQLLLGLVTAIERGMMKVGPLRLVAVGGARVASSLLERAEAVGLPVFEGYGLSECASVVCLNRPGAQRPGSVGRPMPHVQVRIAEDGEVLVRGSTLLGYLGEPSFDGDWWPTGDLGHFDAAGFLYLAGRKKNQFITSFGRNVNPEWVEAELSQTGVILQAFVYGEGLPRNVALLWPIDPSVGDETIEQAVQRCNAGLPDYARVHTWRRLPGPLSGADGTLTSNGRPRRQEILRRHRPLITELSQP